MQSKEPGFVITGDNEEEYVNELALTLLYYLSAGIKLVRRQEEDEYLDLYTQIPETTQMRNVLVGKNLAIEFQRVVDYYLNYLQDEDGNCIGLAARQEWTNNILQDKLGFSKYKKPIRVFYKIIPGLEWNLEKFKEVKKYYINTNKLFKYIKDLDDEMFEQFYK